MKGIRLNKRALVLAIAATLSIGIVGCDGVGSKTDLEHVATAKDYLDKNDVKSGIIELKSALQKNPQNAEARRLLGEAYLEIGDGAAAEKELKRALELGVAKEAIVVPLADALAIQGKYQEILDQIEAPENLDPIEKAEVISYRGDAWFSKRKLEKARAEYERALEVDETSGKAKLGLAKLAAANKKVVEADKLIFEALESSPEDANIWFFQAELQKAKGELDKAEESYGQAIKLDARNLMARYQRALLRIGKKEFDSAGEDIEVLKKEAPKSFQRYYAEGVLALYEKKFSEAEAALDESLKYKSNFIQAVFSRGIAHLAQGHRIQAENDFLRVQKAVPNAIKPRQLLAQVKIQKKEYKEAKELLDPVIRFKPDDPVTLDLLGKIEFALGNNEQGMEYLQKLAELKPGDAGVHAWLGLGLLQSGEQAKGIKQLEQAGELAPNFQQGDTFIVQAHLKAKEYDKAERVIGKIARKYPDSPLAGNLMGVVHQEKGDYPRAKKAFESVLAEFPGNPAAANALADMALKEKDYEAARKFYMAVLEKHPKHLKTKLRLAALGALENNPKEMELLLKEAIEDYPDVLVPRLYLSRYYTRYGQAGRAQTLLEEVKAQYGDNAQLLSALFEAQLADKNVTRALETAKRLVEVAPKSAQAQFMLATAYEAKRDLDNMRIAIARVLDLDPKHLKARIAQVKLLALGGKTAEAARKLTELAKELPDNVAVIELQGWSASRNKNYLESVLAYKRVFDKQPTTRSVIVLAKAYWRANRKGESIELLQKWIKEHPEDVHSHYALSEVYSASGRESDSINTLKKVLNLNPDHVLALNDLAWKLLKKEPVKALAYAEKGYEKSKGKYIPLIDTFAMALLENGQAKRALSVLEQGVRLSPKTDFLRYHFALAWVENGQPEKAVEILKALLAENGSFNERREAERLLGKLLN